MKRRRIWTERASQFERQDCTHPGVQPPTTSSYRVVPRRLLAGAYPGAARPPVHRMRGTDLMGAGVRVFISLMEVDETNHEGQPFVPYEDLDESLHPTAACVRFPIQDQSVPTVEQMPATLNAIDRFLGARRVVYIHCPGGVGRTGTVVACWWLRHGLAAPEVVLKKLTWLRRQDRERSRRLSPESPVPTGIRRQDLPSGKQCGGRCWSVTA